MKNVTFLFACLCLCILGKAVQVDVFGLSGGEIELSPVSSEASSITKILWRHDDDKLADWEMNDAEPDYYGIYKNRTSLDTKTGVLKITNLSTSDNALYSVQINNKTTSKTYVCLVVINALDKPAVSCQVNNDSTVTLLCAADQSPMTQYSWEGPGTHQPGYKLQIGGEESQNSDSVYRCVVKNPVSESREDFPVKRCFPAQVNYSAIIGAVAGVLAILCVVLGLFWCYQNHRELWPCLPSSQPTATARTEESHPLHPAPPAGQDANSSQPATEGSAPNENDRSAGTCQPLEEVLSVAETGSNPGDRVIVGGNGTNGPVEIQMMPADTTGPVGPQTLQQHGTEQMESHICEEEKIPFL